MAMNLMMKLIIVMSLIMKGDLLEEVGMIEKRNFSMLKRKIPEQYKEMRTITSLNLLQHSHSGEKFNIQSSFLYPIKDFVPGIFIHSAREHNIFYSVHDNRPTMHC